MSERALLIVGAGAVLTVALLGYVAARRAGLTAEGALNPASPNNIVYRGVNEIGSTITGDSDFTVGGAIYENGVFQSPNVFAFVADAIAAPFIAAGKTLRGPDASAPEPYVPAMPLWYDPAQSPFGISAP